MRNLFMQSCGILVVLAAAACGSSDDTATSDSSQAAAGSGTSKGTAGKTANSGGSTSSTRGGSGATATGGTTGSTTAPHAGTSASTQPATGGKGGSGGKSAAMADEDAGVPAAGGKGGSAGHGGSGGAGNGGSNAAGSGGSSASAATFTEVYALLSKGCAGATCHVNASAAGGMLSMPDKATAYKNLVNVDATQCRGEKRVVPSDPAKSELVASLKHTQVGSCARTPRMPDNMPQWKDSDIAVVTSWVEAGAQDN